MKLLTAILTLLTLATWRAEADPLPRADLVEDKTKSCALFDNRDYASTTFSYASKYYKRPEEIEGRHVEQITILGEYALQRSLTSVEAIHLFIASSGKWRDLSFKGVPYESVLMQFDRSYAEVYFEYGTANVVAVSIFHHISCISKPSASFGKADYKVFVGPCRIEKVIGEDKFGAAKIQIAMEDNKIKALINFGPTGGRFEAIEEIKYGNYYSVVNDKLIKTRGPVLEFVWSTLQGTQASTGLVVEIAGQNVIEVDRKNSQIDVDIACKQCGKMMVTYIVPADRRGKSEANAIYAEPSRNDLGNPNELLAEAARMLNNLVYNRALAQCQ